MFMLMMIMGVVMMMMMMTWEGEEKIERRYVAPMEGRRLFCDNSTMIESSDSDDKIRMIIYNNYINDDSCVSIGGLFCQRIF